MITTERKYNKGQYRMRKDDKECQRIRKYKKERQKITKKDQRMTKGNKENVLKDIKGQQSKTKATKKDYG